METGVENNDDPDPWARLVGVAMAETGRRVTLFWGRGAK